MKPIILLLVVTLLCSCGESHRESSSVLVYNDSIVIIHSPEEPAELIMYQSVLAFGKIQQTVFPDSMKVEQNLLSQISSYNSAILHGDANTCASYLYPDAVKYMKRFYTGFSDDEIINELFKSISGEMQLTLRKMERYGIELQIIVPNLVRKVNIGDEIIIVFNSTSNLYSETVYTYNKEMERCIAISHNGGVNWWFITENEDTPTILKMRYSQDVVNKVMGYSL